MAIGSLRYGSGRDEQGLPTGRTCLAEVVTQIIAKKGFDYVLKNRQGLRNGQVGARERRGVGRSSVTILENSVTILSWAVGCQFLTSSQTSFGPFWPHP